MHIKRCAAVQYRSSKLAAAAEVLAASGRIVPTDGAFTRCAQHRGGARANRQFERRSDVISGVGRDAEIGLPEAFPVLERRAGGSGLVNGQFAQGVAQGEVAALYLVAGGGDDFQGKGLGAGLRQEEQQQGKGGDVFHGWQVDWMDAQKVKARKTELPALIFQDGKFTRNRFWPQVLPVIDR